MQEPEVSASRKFVSDLKDGDYVSMPLLIAKTQLRDRSNGLKYLALVLADRTGRIDGRIWDNAIALHSAHAEGSVVIAKGQIKAFEGKLQLLVSRLETGKPGEFEASDFLPSTTADRDAMLEDIRACIRGLRTDALRNLLDAYFDDESFISAFMAAPGAVSVHHNYIGGLLEHTHSVLVLCRTALQLYPALNEDLLMAGAILHDVGKTEKYRYDTVIDMSDKGQFMGHIALAAIGLQEKLNTCGAEVTEETRLQLMHLILSHHGSLEWGSPVEPKTLEALVLHFADNMDAKVNQFQQVMKSHAETGRKWTNYDPRLGRSLYVGDTAD